MTPTPETLNAISLMAAGGGLVCAGLAMARVLARPHYVATESVNVLQGVNQRVESPIVEPPEPEAAMLVHTHTSGYGAKPSNN